MCMYVYVYVCVWGAVCSRACMGKMRNAYKRVYRNSKVKRLLTRAKHRWDIIKVIEISCSHGGECEDGCFVCCCPVNSGKILPTF
jgi:hypothetical protein